MPEPFRHRFAVMNFLSGRSLPQPIGGTRRTSARIAAVRIRVRRQIANDSSPSSYAFNQWRT